MSLTPLRISKSGYSAKVLSIFTFTGLHVLWLTIVFAGSMSLTAYGQDATRTIQEMKKLSLEELMNLEVTSASKHPEKLIETSSAIQLMTEADIRHSGATSVRQSAYSKQHHFPSFCDKTHTTFAYTLRSISFAVGESEMNSV
jgi:hypothetical protein